MKNQLIIGGLESLITKSSDDNDSELITENAGHKSCNKHFKELLKEKPP